MRLVIRHLAQLAVIAILFTGVAHISNWPVYRILPEGNGVVMLSFTHGADRKASCRKLTPAEIAKLPPNMRRTDDCPRGRPPIYVELDIGGRQAYSATLKPTGIAGDNASRVYERFVLASGDYDVTVRMRDTPRAEGFDHVRSGRVALAPGQMFVIDFNATASEFIFR